MMGLVLSTHCASRSQIVDRLYSASGRNELRYLVEEFLINWDGKPEIPLAHKYCMFGDRIALIHSIERDSGARLTNRYWCVMEAWKPLDHKPVLRNARFYLGRIVGRR
jgi:hypothetical protein